MVKVPTVSIDKTDGCMVYLSKDSLATQLVTAKSSEMNILIPDESGEFVRISLSFLGPYRPLVMQNWPILFVYINGSSALFRLLLSAEH